MLLENGLGAFWERSGIVLGASGVISYEVKGAKKRSKIDQCFALLLESGLGTFWDRFGSVWGAILGGLESKKGRLERSFPAVCFLQALKIVF